MPLMGADSARLGITHDKVKVRTVPWQVRWWRGKVAACWLFISPRSRALQTQWRKYWEVTFYTEGIKGLFRFPISTQPISLLYCTYIIFSMLSEGWPDQRQDQVTKDMAKLNPFSISVFTGKTDFQLFQVPEANGKVWSTPGGGGSD